MWKNLQVDQADDPALVVKRLVFNPVTGHIAICQVQRGHGEWIAYYNDTYADRTGEIAFYGDDYRSMVIAAKCRS